MVTGNRSDSCTPILLPVLNVCVVVRMWCCGALFMVVGCGVVKCGALVIMRYGMTWCGNVVVTTEWGCGECSGGVVLYGEL